MYVKDFLSYIYPTREVELINNEMMNVCVYRIALKFIILLLNKD